MAFVMDSINSEFFDLVKNGISPSEAYKKMVEKNSYRIFADPLSADESDTNTEMSQQPNLTSQSILQDWASSDSSSTIVPPPPPVSTVSRMSSLDSSSNVPPPPPVSTVSRMSSVSSVSTNPFGDFSEEEVEFIQLLINAKTVADLNENPVNVEWRGYETTVQPNLPSFSKRTLRERLNSALQHIQVLNVAYYTS